MIEASEAIGQVKFELLAHQKWTCCGDRFKQVTTGQILGAERRREARKGLAERTQPSKGESDVTAVRVKTKKRL